MRTALIKDGHDTVENVVVAGPDYVPPAGYRAVAHDRANIGWKLTDGELNPTLDTHTPEEHYSHLQMRFNGDAGNIFPNVAADGEKPLAVKLQITTMVFEEVRRLRDRAERNPSFTILWETQDKQTVQLNAEQIIRLDDAATDYIIDRRKAYTGVLDAMSKGALTLHNDVDVPPKEFPMWPENDGYLHRPEMMERRK